MKSTAPSETKEPKKSWHQPALKKLASNETEGGGSGDFDTPGPGFQSS